jgi:CheY-like chemotaxis protein
MTATLLAPPGDVGAVADRRLVPILVVDDNPAKRLALKAVLSPLGYAIVEADSGRAALRCIMAQDFAVILLDVRMPLMDGFETAALIRQRLQSEMRRSEPRSRSLPTSSSKRESWPPAPMTSRRPQTN